MKKKTLVVISVYREITFLTLCVSSFLLCIRDFIFCLKSSGWISDELILKTQNLHLVILILNLLCCCFTKMLIIINNKLKVGREVKLTLGRNITLSIYILHIMFFNYCMYNILNIYCVWYFLILKYTDYYIYLSNS